MKCSIVTWFDNFDRSVPELDKTVHDSNTGTPSYKDYWQVKDHLGSVRAVYDLSTTGTIDSKKKELSDYQPYGNRIARTSTSYNHWRFSGKEEQKIDGTDFGLLDFGARYYDPWLARWTTQDPLAHKYAGINPYVYCNGDPVNLVDVEGKDWYTVEEKETIEYKYDDNIASQKDLDKRGIKGNYIGPVAFNESGDTYYSLFGETVRYRDSSGKLTFEGQMYQKIDALLMAQEQQINNPETTSEIGRAHCENFYFGFPKSQYRRFHYDGYFEGQRFLSSKEATLYQGMNSEFGSLYITSMPNRYRQVRGWIGAPVWYGYFITIGVGNNDKIHIQYDETNGPIFKAAFLKHVKIHK